MEETLKKGMSVGIHSNTGLIVRSGIQGRRLWIKDFKIGALSDDRAFATDDIDWTDETQPLAEDPDNLAMFAHCGMWRPGMPKPELMAVLVNLHNGKCRRLPYQNGIALAGSFSPDRQKVYVFGQGVGDKPLAITEITLASGKNRPIAPDSLGAMTMRPLVSPDGRYLAVVEPLASDDLLQSQLRLIDLVSDEVVALGERFDMNVPSWLPDSRGLIFERRIYRSRNERATSTICRMDINDGTLTDIRAGSDPAVLRQSQRILFEEADGNGHVWKTCDFDGSSVKPVGDGLKEFSFAGASSTGDEVIMMKFGGSEGPRPYLVNPITGKSKPIPVGPGLWAWPVWQ